MDNKTFVNKYRIGQAVRQWDRFLLPGHNAATAGGPSEEFCCAGGWGQMQIGHLVFASAASSSLSSC
jgi:hypothetical protein